MQEYILQLSTNAVLLHLVVAAVAVVAAVVAIAVGCI
jgi:hypothetical protein